MSDSRPTHQTGAAALEVRNLGVTLGQHPVLQGLNLKLPQGRWSAIVGPNGAGKSTLLQALAGVLPFHGDIYLFDQALSRFTAQHRARQVAWLAQGSVQSADDLTVYDVAMLGRLPHQSWLGGPSHADHVATEQALRLTQAWPWRQRALGTLSGGEKQRVLLARLLAVDADILLMDEPLANLDPPHQVDWLLLVRDLVACGKTVVSVLHEVTLALYADELIVMAGGTIQHTGTRDDPVLHRTIESVFDYRIAIEALGTGWVALPKLL